MDAPKRKPVGADMVIAFGGKGRDEAASDDGGDHEYSGDEDSDTAGDSDVPAAFESAYDDHQKDPSAATMYAMIRACKG